MHIAVDLVADVVTVMAPARGSQPASVAEEDRDNEAIDENGSESDAAITNAESCPARTRWIIRTDHVYDFWSVYDGHRANGAHLRARLDPLSFDRRPQTREL